MSEQVKIRRLQTGIPGLDDLLGGGLPEFSLNLIAGTPGSGKTTFAQQMMFHMATPDNRAIYFTVLGEPPMKMLRYQQQFSFFDIKKVNQSIRFVNLSTDLLLLQQANERLIIASVEAQKMATQVKIATDQMEIAKCAAETANLAKTSFLSNMSHELRTPLNAILGFAQLLEAGKPTPTDTQRVWLNQITTAGWYLLDLINQILDLSIIELGHVKLEYQSVSMAEILSECEGMIELQAEKLNVHIHFQPVDATLVVETDFTRLKQIILNLLSNAIKYNHPQGTVEVTCTALPQHIRINIKDSGIGLSPEMQADLFQPFNRLGQEKSAKQGTGIGLVVTKQLVELMGGVIGFTSDLGVGSDFWIELPLENTRTITEETAEIERGIMQ